MASTYGNDLRLEEIGTGEQSGSWGTTTNTNLELIAEAFGYGTEDLSSDANATITMQDGTSDGFRAMYLKITSSATLTATRTITFAPNTVSKVWIVENATTGDQDIVISQGSGSTVTVPFGTTKILYTDGAGSGAAVVDALASISFAGATIADLGTVTTADINGGTADDVTIGAGTPAPGTFTSITGSDDLVIDTDLLFVDQSTGRVGIGTASPSNLLDVDGTARVGTLRYPTSMLQTAIGRSYTASTSSTDMFDIVTTNGFATYEVSVFYRDTSFPAGTFFTKLYIATRGSGSRIASIALTQENKVRSASGSLTGYGTWGTSIVTTSNTDDTIRLNYTATDTSGGASVYIHVTGTVLSDVNVA